MPRNKSLDRAIRRLIPEAERMAALQQSKIVSRLAKAPSRVVEAETDLLIRRRHARRRARIQQKASRRRNRR